MTDQDQAHRPVGGTTDEPDTSRCSEPLDTEDGTVVICQDAGGADTVAGGGEFPDRDAPPTEPAPGAAE